MLNIDMRKFLIILLLFSSHGLVAQINLTVEGIDYTMASHNGYEIARSSLTNLIFRYSRITSNYDDGFLLMAGDNDYNASTSYKLPGAQIYGSRFIGTNTYPSGSLHALMVGYNANYDIHHNYISAYDYGITNEGGYPDHTSTINTTGGIYYNIFKNNLYNIVNKGHDGTRIYNNTFYTTFNEQGQFIGVKQSDTGGFTEPHPSSKNTKIKNNIFYYSGSFSQFHAIRIGETGDDTAAEMDTVGLEIDYNVYYYTNTTGNKPFFGFNGATLTWEQWRALGYDEHSIILDPNFIDTDEFVPTNRIDFGIAISGFETGLSAEYPTWTVDEMPSTNVQGSTWQPGARIYETVEDNATDILTFTLPTQTGAATINSTNHTVAIEVNYLATLTNLAPFISLSYGATISPASMVSRDFTTPQTYTVTALDGTTTQDWTVTVTQEEAPKRVVPVMNGNRVLLNGNKIVRLN